MNYKNYEIEKRNFKDNKNNIIKGFLVYPKNSFNDNVVLKSLEDVYIYIDRDIKRIEQNEKDEKTHKEYLKNQEEKKNKIEFYLNKFIDSEHIFYKKLPFEKIKHFLKDNIKCRFNTEKIDYTIEKNFIQIEYLFKLGYRATKKNNKYQAKNKENQFFNLKKTEYLYLKFLEGYKNE